MVSGDDRTVGQRESLRRQHGGERDYQAQPRRVSKVFS
jgi:hypothetical protein